MEIDYRVKLEKWVSENLKELSDEQLQKLADQLETYTYENDYKDYI